MIPPETSIRGSSISCFLDVNIDLIYFFILN